MKIRQIRAGTVMTKKVNKGMSAVFIAVVALVLVTYLAMLLNTNNLMREVESVFLLEVDLLETDGRPIDVYNFRWLHEHEVFVGQIDFTITRRFVLHNFRTGYIWVQYTYLVYDEAGELLSGSLKARARWSIRKTNGAWDITAGSVK